MMFSRTTWILCGLCLLIAQPVRAQAVADADPATDKQLPSAEQILEKHLEAIGGRDRLEKQKTTVTKGKLKMPESGLEADISLYQKAPSQFMLEFELPNLGQFRKGTNGELAWEINPMMGARLLEGKEKTQFMKEADVQAQLHPEKYYQTMKTIEQVDLDGTPHFKVLLVTKDDVKETRYYDAETYLLSRIEQIAITPMGDLEVSVSIDDYRDVDGIHLPFEMSQNIMGQQQVFAFDSIEINGDVDDSMFTVPDEVEELVAKDKE